MTEVTLVGPAWRYPELAVAERWSEQVSDLTRARLIAQGLASRYTPETAVRYLIGAGEFEVAERVLDEIARSGFADGPRVDRLWRELTEQRNANADDARDLAWVLRERAERIGWEALDVDAVSADASVRRADGLTHLAELEQQISAAEQRRGGEIENALNVRLAAAGTPQGRDPSDDLARAWRDEILALLAAREYEAARRVLDEGPGGLSVLPVEQPVESWPWTSAETDEILGWFGPGRAYAPPRLRLQYVLDETGEKLLRAIGEVAAAADTGPGTLAEAIQELIGVEGVPAQVRRLPEEMSEFTLRIPDDLRLPPLTVTGRVGIPVVIGDRKPSARAARLTTWLSTRVRERKDHGVLTLDLSDLLSLLQAERPRGGRPRSPASRRMGLIRVICCQLPVGDVLAPNAFAGTAHGDLRSQVWWLLHAFGVSPDGVAVDTLLEETGEQPGVLVPALHYAVQYAREQGFARLQPETFTRLRTSLEYRAAVTARIEAELGDEAAAALYTIVFFKAADDLRAALDTVAADAGLTAPVDRLVDVPRALDLLRRCRYLATDDAGNTVLCESGVTRQLRRADAHELAKRTLARLAPVPDPKAYSDPASVPTSEEVRRLQFQRWLAEIEVHHERRRAERAEERTRELLGGPDTEERILKDRRLREERQKVEDWSTERVAIDLIATCRDVAREVESYSHGVEILPPVGAPVTVTGSRMALRIALHNLISNAQLEVEKHNPPDAREVAVSVLVPASDPGYAWVDIEDNGPGMPAEVKRLMARGEAWVPSTRHQSHGQGLVGARELLRLLAGTLEVPDEPSAILGGAHVRIRLPLAGG
jgi:signal transduction histidine kinase